MLVPGKKESKVATYKAGYGCSKLLLYNLVRILALKCPSMLLE